MVGRVFIGTSGYAYPHWRGRFYPVEMPAAAWFAHYAEHLSTVELNRPFYQLPTAATFAAWRRAAPRGFVFAVKASRYLTHMKKLKDPGPPLRRLLGRARALGPTLGPVLFQLPRNFRVDLDRLEGFLAALGRQRSVPRLRAVLEVRHESWLAPDVVDRLERARVALCLHDAAQLSVTGPLTAPFVYVRRHGTSGRYQGSYPARALAKDARQIRTWAHQGRDVYVYFNNDQRAFAVANALRLECSSREHRLCNFHNRQTVK
jgi:uncharacterized protein YecE (DUF72 family)